MGNPLLLDMGDNFMSTVQTEVPIVVRSASLYDIIVAKIGRNYHKIDIHSLWADRYRVNVWAEVKLDNKERGKGFYEVKADTDIIKEKRIVKSFFIRYNNGAISYCNPPLE